MNARSCSRVASNASKRSYRVALPTIQTHSTAAPIKATPSKRKHRINRRQGLAGPADQNEVEERVDGETNSKLFPRGAVNDSNTIDCEYVQKSQTKAINAINDVNATDGVARITQTRL